LNYVKRYDNLKNIDVTNIFRKKNAMIYLFKCLFMFMLQMHILNLAIDLSSIDLLIKLIESVNYHLLQISN